MIDLLARRASRRRARPVLIAAAGTVLAVTAIALVGPVLAPHPPTAQIGLPFLPPGPDHPLGTDAIGRDALSRVLHGGTAVIVLATGATLLGSAAGLLIGLLTGLARPQVGEAVMRVVDLLVVVPALLVLLVLAAGFPGSDPAVMAAIALVSVPFSARVIRSATQQLIRRGFVEIARARGDSRWQILRHDLAPNIAGPALAEAGVRFSAAVNLTATAGFLGLGRGSPAANWGRMVHENAAGLSLTVWPVLVPALLLVAFTVAVNLLTDDLAARWVRPA